MPNSRTIQEIRSYVRTYLDVDAEDLPDSLMDSWLQDGFNQMVSVEQRWPGFEKDAEFTTVADQQSYLGSQIAADLRVQDITHVEIDQYPLEYRDHDEMRLKHPRNSAPSGTPWWYSLWANKLWLWPAPGSSTFTVFVSYYRNPTDWIAGGAGAMPDLPSEFGFTLQEYVLANAYLHQEDPELATVHFTAFSNAFEALKKAETRPNPQRPIVLGGRRQGRMFTPNRLRWPWD